MLSKMNRSSHTDYFDNSHESEPIVLVCAADDRYAMPLAVMARSALENIRSDRKVNLFIVDAGIKEVNKRKVLKSLDSGRCEVVFLPKPELLIKDIEAAHNYCVMEEIQAKTHLSMAAYYRLLIAELLPEYIERAIYLDCDLVVKGNLEDLWNIDFEDNYILGVPDMWIHSVSARNGLLNYRELGIEPNTKYFNSGVMVINVRKWRTEEVFDRMVNYFKENKRYIRFHDQDILNAVFAGNWGELDPRWNVTPGIYEYSSWKESPYSEDLYTQLFHNPYIIHFAAAEKPWNSHDALLKEHFFHYVDTTAWAGWRFTPWRQLQMKLAYKFKKLKTIISNFGRES
jgi:lipopolysaccharide biosynthesis glycosyltransferase